MRKVVSVLLVLVMVFALLPVFVSANDDITVTIDGVPVVFEGQGPIITGNRTLVPVRGVFEVLGFYPTWDGPARQATLTRDDFVVVLTIGSSTFTTNGVEHTLDVPAQLIAGRTLLPLRAVLESVGYDDMAWVGATRTVVIRTGAVVPQTPTPTPQPDVTPTPSPTLQPIPTPGPMPDADVGEIISAPTEARRNEILTIYFQGEPNTQYTLSIISAAGNPLTADGLGSTISDSNGVASWTWLVGGRTGAGVQRVTISGGSKAVTHNILIIVD